MGIIIGGKRKDNGEWVYGAYFYIRHTDGRNHTHHLIIPDGIDMSIGTPIEKIQVEVDPDTMGIFSWDGNTEPKELLFVEREKVIKKCDEVTKDYAETGDKWCSGYINALNDFFGNKCLSDNNDSKGIDCNKLDQMLDEALEKETPESLNKWLDEQNQSSQSGSGFKKGDIVKFMGNYCKVTDCPTEPHYALSYLVGAHRGQSVVGPIKESHIKACPEFEAIPFKIGDRVRERDYEESFGTVVAFNVNGKCEITMFVQLDKEGRYIEGYPDEFVAIPPKPKFNIGDKVVGSNEHTAKEWPGVMEVTDYKFEKEKSRYLYYTREFGNIWFPESTLKLYVEIPSQSESKFHRGDKVINLLTGEVHIIEETDCQDGIWDYLVYDSEDNSKWLNESDLAPYNESENKVMPTNEEIYKIAREVAEKMCVDEYYLHEDIDDVSKVLKVLFQDYRIVSKKRLHDYYKSATRQANAPSSDPRDAYEIQDAKSQLLVLENLFTKKEFEEDE